ncbi:MAG: class I SAM-dependent methyltransferase, partial [Anaerolineae bacterium]|nr:class I SAM-dependent methyltransferase [Anaerolineae bacterium]
MLESSGSRYDSTRQAWEDIWARADVQIELDALRETRTADQLGVFPAYLSKEGIILEAGVGLGATMIWLREQGFRMIGLDYAVNALRAARAYDPALNMQAGDVHALPYRSGSLHGYLSFGVLEHFEHGMGPALREANRVLAPGGTLVLTIPYPNVVHRLVGWKRRLLGQGRLTDDAFYESTYTQRDLIREVKAAGFMPALVKPTSHAYTLWGLGGPFRAPGYYRASPLADRLGSVLRVALPWAFNFSTMVIARKV